MASYSETIVFWLNTAGKYPLLPKEEIIRLGRVIQNHPVGNRKREKALDKLVRHNLRLIPSIVRRCVSSKRTHRFGDDWTEDLLQCGVVGLRRAAEKYDPSTGYAFSTYAAAWIFQAVHREIYSNLSIMKVPESTIRELYHAIEKSQDLSFRDLDKSKRDRMTAALTALSMFSLDAAGGREESESDHAYLACINANARDVALPENGIDDYGFMSFDSILGLASLTKHQRTVLRHVYVDGLNQRQTGERMGVCTSTVKETLKRAHGRLAAALDR